MCYVETSSHGNGHVTKIGRAASLATTIDGRRPMAAGSISRTVASALAGPMGRSKRRPNGCKRAPTTTGENGVSTPCTTQATCQVLAAISGRNSAMVSSAGSGFPHAYLARLMARTFSPTRVLGVCAGGTASTGFSARPINGCPHVTRVAIGV